MKIRIAAVAAAAAALALSGCSSSDSGSEAANAQGFPETITLAAIPAENSSDLKASYAPAPRSSSCRPPTTPVSSRA